MQCTKASSGKRPTCFLSTMLAGRTRSMSAPSDRSALTFSSATSSGIMIAIKTFSLHCPQTVRLRYTYSFHTLYNFHVSTQGKQPKDSCEPKYLAFATVAMEIPVEPTVPSNIREPVFGNSRPCLSASSITEKRCQNYGHSESKSKNAYFAALHGL